MKVFSVITALTLVALGAAAGWFFASRTTAPPEGSAKKEIAFYQSPMHPWITSEEPGNCTICGMKLTPVYVGEKGIEVDPGIVTLSSNIVNVIHVQTEPVQRLPLTRSLEVAGRIEADKTRYRVISAYIGGRIEELFVNYIGAEVRAGEPLATIYSPELLTAEREFLTILNQTNLNSSPMVSSQHDQMVQAARERLKRFGLQDSQIEELATKPGTNYTTRITAPISGTVLSRNVYEGQYVQEGDKLFELADLSTMWFRFDVYEQDLSWIKLGQTVHVTSAALGGKHLQGPITFIEPTIDETTRSAGVRVELENPLIGEGENQHHALYNNLYAKGVIEIESKPVLAVPRSAVLQPGDQARVYVATGGGAYEAVPVQLGRHGDDYWEILDGLSGDEQVVTTGSFLIDSEAQIQNGSGHQHSSPAAAPAEPAGPGHSGHSHGSLTPEQKTAISKLFALSAEMNEGLAEDNLDAFNSRIELLNRAAATFLNDLEHSQFPAALPSHSTFQEAATLESARKQYLPFSNQLAQFALTLQKAGAKGIPEVYKCPMYPRPGQTALWVQNEGPVRNPFYGSEMLDCGAPVN